MTPILCNSDSGKKIRRALFPGSFNPFTKGHQSLVDRGLGLFDEIIIAVGVSYDKRNSKELTVRMSQIADLYKGDRRIKVISYTGLTVNTAREEGADFILRGVRNAADMEYERNMADVNRRIAGIETVLLMTLPEMSMISSSIVRELEHFGEDVSDFLPKRQ